MGNAFEEADLRAGLKEGGQVLGAFIVARGCPPGFVVYVRANWIRGRGFRIIRSWRGHAGDRTFKHLDSAWRFIDRFGFSGRITVYRVGDPELRQFSGVAASDLGDSAPGELSALAGAALEGGR